MSTAVRRLLEVLFSTGGGTISGIISFDLYFDVTIVRKVSPGILVELVEGNIFKLKGEQLPTYSCIFSFGCDDFELQSPAICSLDIFWS